MASARRGDNRPRLLARQIAGWVTPQAAASFCSLPLSAIAQATAAHTGFGSKAACGFMPAT
jgi:hypothetical protein